MARTVEDAVMLIRDWVGARGCDAARVLEACAKDAAGIAHYDETHPLHLASFGDSMGGPENAAKARKAERQYRLAAWVCRRIQVGRDAHDEAQALAFAKAEEARIAALPRVNCWGKPL